MPRVARAFPCSIDCSEARLASSLLACLQCASLLVYFFGLFRQIQELNRDMTKMNQKRAELKGRLHGMKDQVLDEGLGLPSSATSILRCWIEYRTREYDLKSSQLAVHETSINMQCLPTSCPVCPH